MAWARLFRRQRKTDMYKFQNIPLKDIKRNLKKVAKAEKVTLSEKQEQYAKKQGFVSWASLIHHIKTSFELPIVIIPRFERVDFAQPVTVNLTKDKKAIAIAGDLGDGKTFIAIEVLHQAFSQGWAVEFIGAGEITDSSAQKYLDHKLLYNYRHMSGFAYSPFCIDRSESIQFESRASETSKDTFKLVIVEQAGRVLKNEAISTVIANADAVLLLTQGEPLKINRMDVESHYLTKGALNRASSWRSAISHSLHCNV